MDLIAASDRINKQEVSSRELVEGCLERINESSETNAFISVFDDAVDVAIAADSLSSAGYRIGPLHGVPVAVKDNIHIKDRVTTGGSAILKGCISENDAVVIERLRSAGAIIIGKTNLHEYAWGGTSANPTYGFVKNPWDLNRMPGGSSGGSGVAVATGSCFGALGTDTGGSVRLPAAFNGVTGIRPTIGRVSNQGVIPLAWTMDTVGPMARSARDCALLMDVLAGHTGDSLMAHDYVRASSGLNKGVEGLRIGVIEGYSFYNIQPAVETALRETLDVFINLGATVQDVRVPDIEGNISAQLTVEAAEPSTYHQQNLRSKRDQYGDDVRVLLQAGELIPAVHYIQAQRYRKLLRNQMLSVFDNVDVVVCPTSPFTATPLGDTTVNISGSEEDMLAAIMQFTGLPSLAGLPAVSVPAGVDSFGLPIGIQLIGKPFAESVVLRCANAFQSRTDYHEREPELYS